MIFGNILSSQDFDFLPSALKKALEYVQSSGLDKLPLGRHNIDGELMFANVMEFEAGVAEQKLAEVHKEYIDVQFLISGFERIGYGLANKSNPISTEYDSENDYYLVESMKHECEVLLEPGMFAIFFPEEPHKPGCRYVDEHASMTCDNYMLKKVVVKVHRSLI